jgi:pimeloyl-ACP methyl ester carboxylesterase
MSATLLTAWVYLMTAPRPLPASFVQIAPQAAAAEFLFQRSSDRYRAVVLIHGLRPHPFRDSPVVQADLSIWEEPASPLVRRLGQDSDVYAFSYGQNVPVDDVAAAPELASGVRRLRAMGYEQVVLVGYSAGGLVARQFVEDEPDGGGATRVIQVCCPNGGSSWGKFSAALSKRQSAFMQSLTKEARQVARAARAGRDIPSSVEFVCLVGSLGVLGDGLVRCDCQWTRELQQQGVPAVVAFTQHAGAMMSPVLANRIAELARDPQPRWDAFQVETVRRKLFGKD